MRLPGNYLFLLLLPLFFGCPGGAIDTCNDALGDTFDSVSVLTTDRTADGGYDLALRLEALDTLPSAYFEASVILQSGLLPDGSEVGADAASSTIVESSRDLLRLRVGAEALADDRIELLLRYPDRRDFIACEHPGSGDRYLLLLEYDLAETSRVEFNWEEDFRAGGF